MADAIDSLWSPEIRAGVLSPFAILEPQARALTKQTKGILVGEVKVAHDEDGKNTYLHLDLVVPALDNYRHRILTATHRADMMYPVEVDAACFRSIVPAFPALFGSLAGGPRKANEASSDTELQALIEKVLKSAEVKALAVSLIARANDVLRRKEGAAEKPAEDEPA